MPQLSWAEWEAKSKYRCLHYKFKEQLHWLKDFYPEKIDRLQRRLDDILAGHIGETEENVILLQEKIARLTDKFETTLKEIEGRKLGHFKNRPEHGTLYYIDLDGGNDGADGLGIGTAWLTLEKYTEVTPRNPGDIAKVRANTDEVVNAHTAFDEDGDQDDWIEIRGCSVADDPWSDGSNVKPIRSYNDTPNWRANLDTSFWKFIRLIFKESVAIGGVIQSDFSQGICYYLNCEITDNSNANGIGVSLTLGGVSIFETCVFKDNLGKNLYLSESTAKLIGCALDGGGATTDYGIYGKKNARVEAVDCNLGQVTSHDIADIIALTGTIVKTRNCLLDIAAVADDSGAVIFSEDDDGTYGTGLITEYQGTITKDTGVKTGAATFSLKFEPNTNCGINNFLTPNHESIIEYPFIIECTTGVSKTVTVQIRSLGTWGTYPVATELFLEFWYLDHAVNATRTKVVSTDVLSHASNWVSFTVTFTPLQTGLAYGTVKMGVYEDVGDGAYVNGEST